MTNTTPHRATPEQWEDAEWFGNLERVPKPLSYYACILELRSRVEALEAGATCPHVVTGAEGTSYCGLAEQQAAASAPPEPAPAVSLVERVGRAISLDAWDDAGNWTAEARAAIRAVAEWMRSQDLSTGDYWAGRLEQETER